MGKAIVTTTFCIVLLTSGGAMSQMFTPVVQSAIDKLDHQKYDDALHILKSEIGSGDPVVWYFYGIALEMSSVDEANSESEKWILQSLRSFKSGSATGDLMSKYMIGEVYLSTGVGELSDAYKETKLAAELGHAEAMYNMSIFSRDYDLSDGKDVYWLRKAAENGVVDAQYVLGAMYSTGEGVDINADEAIKFYKMAAVKGHSPSQFNYGLMLFLGDAGEVDKDEGMHWIMKSASNGYDAALLFVEQSK